MPMPKSGGSLGCEACQDGVKVLNDLLDSPLVKGSLITLLQGLCKELPPSYATNCVDTIKPEITEIIKFITDMTSHICTDGLHCGTAGFPLENAAQCNHLDLECRACNGLHGIYNNVAKLTTEVSAVCSHLRDPTHRANCETLFSKEMASVVRIGQGVVAWTARHVPLVPPCHIGQSGSSSSMPGMAMAPNGLVMNIMRQFAEMHAMKAPATGA